MIIFNENRAAFVAYKIYCYSTQSSKPTKKKMKKKTKPNAKDTENK